MTKKVFKPSAAQQTFFDWIVNGDGSAVVEAVAGSGKTTTMVEGLKLMTGRIWFGVYNTKMGKEIKEKIAADDFLRTRPGLYASTFHSAGMKCLGFAFGRDNALKLNADKCRDIMRKWIRDAEADRIHLREITSVVCKVVDMAKNRGIGALVSIDDRAEWENMILHFDLDRDLPDHFTMSELMNTARTILQLSNNDLSEIDFSDMIYLPLQRGLKPLQHEWVIIDEAQDTNPVRRALAEKLLAPGGRLTAVGDKRQGIFGFTGADNDALEQIAQAFDCTYFPLTITYRCPKAVVAVAQKVVPHIECADTAPEGKVLGLDYEEIANVLSATDRKHRDTAILCRYNKYLVSTCFALIRAGVPAKIEGREIGNGLVKLATRWKRIKNLPALEDKLEEHRAREIAKATEKEDTAKVDRVNDVIDTLKVLIDRAHQKKMTTVQELVGLILEMFDDNVSDKNLVTLCSVHKSKGLEWPWVFILGLDELMPSPMATKDWELEQEDNLIYVAVTRAKDTMVNVFGVYEEEPKA
jgi:superfamily I DNA/RNA helicase